MTVYTTLGMDPGLRHGALVLASFDFSRGADKQSALKNFELIYFWNQKSPLSLSEESGPDEMMHLTAALVSAIREKMSGNYRGSTIAIDWDPYSIYWGSRKMQGVKLAYFMGYLARAFQEVGIRVIYYEPKVVRQRLGIAAKTEKETVWKVIKEHITGNGEVHNLYQAVMMAKRDGGDILDAFILAYLVARAQSGVAIETED